MPIKEQEEWLRNPKAIGDNKSPRIVDEDLRRKYRGRLPLFMKEKYANEAVEHLRNYIQLCIPAVRRSEVSFWIVSCLPQKNVYSRINIYWQEVLTVYVHKKELMFSIHLSKSPFEKLSDKKWIALFVDYPSLEGFNHAYEKGGQDQFNLKVSENDFGKFIQDQRILPAIRLFNLRLMKIGVCVRKNNHCLDLADKLV
jgi:hypothetical protein